MIAARLQAHALPSSARLRQPECDAATFRTCSISTIQPRLQNYTIRTAKYYRTSTPPDTASARQIADITFMVPERHNRDASSYVPA
jgi:hypothetical protein